MKIKSIIFFVLIALALQLNSCTKEKKTKSAKAHSEQKIASDTIFDRESPYYIFIQKNNPDLIKEKLFFFKEQDIDLDGINEAIVALGNYTEEGTKIRYLFILKNDKGTIKQVIGSFNLNDSDFFANEVSLIKLQNQQETCIAVKYNLVSSSNTGVSIFELKNNHLNVIQETRLSRFEKEYEERLVDDDDDGEYEGYSQRVTYDGRINYYKDTNFAFENGICIEKGSQNYMDAYPDEIQDVLLQYIRLRSEPFNDNIINYRLNELCIDANANAIKWNKNWYGIGVRSYYHIRDGDDFGICEIQEEDDDTAIVIATNKYLDPDKNQGFYQLQFSLQKTLDKWQITKVEVIR
ncbi:hypothetical protein [Flavobacterium tistrianum]|uniref:hypothetical protein n=1 Tax=Flavobacterium tistrianum TaxID=1685414 RepID=UPI0013A5F9A4|nr:hypothetical protein [Flavobacterium tistrianum]KAF2339782.1 hypothetical protein DMB71_15050 [Flavobacterium tistrianum]